MLAPQDQLEIQIILNAARAQTLTEEAKRLIVQAYNNRRAAVMQLFAEKNVNACKFIIKHGGSFFDLALAAASHGNIRALDLFIQNAVKADHLYHKNDILHSAAKFNHGAVIGHVIRNYPTSDIDFIWVACGAALGGNTPLVNKLLDHEIKVKNRELNQNDLRKVAQYAAEGHHVELTQSLLSRSPEFSATDYIYVAKGAARSGDERFVNALLDKAIFISDDDYVNLAINAAGCGYTELALNLLNRIVEPGQRSYDDVAAMAHRNRHFDCEHAIKLAKPITVKEKMPEVLIHYPMKAVFSRAASSSAPEATSGHSKVSEVIALKRTIAVMEVELAKMKAQVQALESTNKSLRNNLTPNQGRSAKRM